MTRIASDIRRKRKQFEREAAKAARRRKVHCGERQVHRIGNPVGKSYCGLNPITWSNGKSVEILAPEQFIWLPRSSQCENCRDLGAAIHRSSATPEMLTAVECIIVAIERLDQAAQLVPHKDRGCYFLIDSDCCWCGTFTLTNPAYNGVRLKYEGDRVLERIQESMRQKSPTEQAAIARLQREHDESMAALRGERV